MTDRAAFKTGGNGGSVEAGAGLGSGTEATPSEPEMLFLPAEELVAGSPKFSRRATGLFLVGAGVLKNAPGIWRIGVAVGWKVAIVHFFLGQTPLSSRGQRRTGTSPPLRDGASGGVDLGVIEIRLKSLRQLYEAGDRAGESDTRSWTQSARLFEICCFFVWMREASWHKHF